MDEQNISIVNDLKAAIEAILFAAGHPVKYEKLSEVLGIGVKEIRILTEHLAEMYAEEDGGRGIMLVNYPESASCQLCTKEQFAPYIREALGIRKGGNLSNSSLEVLAIVAYNQPVTRSFIDAVRGTDSTYATNSLIDKELIEACGRLDAPGRPMLYKTTDKFLRVFGLSSLEELPVAEYLTLPDEESKDSKESNESGESNKTEESRESSASVGSDDSETSNK